MHQASVHAAMRSGSRFWLLAAALLAACGPVPDEAVDAGATALDASTPRDAGEPDAGGCAPASCDDRDPCTLDACDGSGCTHAPAADGLACDDGNACTRRDACVAGECAGADPLDCPAPQACEAQGVCEPSTGECTRPLLAEGTTCDDGDLRTFGDACDDAGHCAGTAVACPADTPCASSAPNGTSACVVTFHDAAPCDDGNACTRTDACLAGECVGSNPVECAAPGTCEDAGRCDPGTGECTHPPSLTGTPCDDERLTTYDDSCDGLGVCGGLPVTCPADDACTSWSEDGTSDCVPTFHDAATCDDGNACTRVDSCEAGECIGAHPVTCSAPGVCEEQGSCEPSTGVCSRPRSAVGTSCDDQAPTTHADRCNDAGACAGTPVTCPADDVCTTWTPDGTDTCVPTFHDGARCDDADECTGAGTCAQGSCRLPAPVVCTAAQSCSNGACTCPAGYTGAHCDVDVDECAEGSVCGGGSSCTNATGTYDCSCLTNYSSASGADCTSSVLTVRVALFYDEGVERAFAPYTEERVRDLFLATKAVYDGSLQPATTLSLDALLALPPYSGTGVQLRACNTPDPSQPHCVGCFDRSSSSCAGLVSTSPTESDVNLLLSTFTTYARTTRAAALGALTGGVDVAVLLTNLDFAGPYMGLASVGGTCTSYGGAVAGGVGSTTTQHAAQIVAHELGHTLGMQHDVGTGYIMSASSSATSVPTAFSAQSINAYATWRTGLGARMCLAPGAGDDWAAHTCGNGRLDEGETCDPGLEPDSCCSSTCRLEPGCSCANTEPCCLNGTPRSAGTTCRAALGVCDRADACDGLTGACLDAYESPATACGTGGLCLDRACTDSRDAQCIAVGQRYGQPMRGACPSTRCDRLECRSEGGSCVSWMFRPAEGTTCGTDQQCVSGACLPSAGLKDYRWVPGAWSACPGGPSTRPLSCADETGATVDPSNCDPDAAPATSRTCTP